MKALLKIASACKQFNNIHVIDELSLTIGPGSPHCLMGVNGSGKTTLFNLITGHTELSKGSIRLDNIVLDDLPAYKRARLIARSFQNCNVLDNFSVEENIQLAIRLAIRNGCPMAAAQKKKLDNTVELFELEKLRNIRANQLSFGQRKLLSNALAFARPASLYLFDEPTAGLQPRYIDMLADILSSIEKIVLIIEHNLDFLRKLNCNAHFLSQGKIIESGSIDEITRSPHVKQVYI